MRKREHRVTTCYTDDEYKMLRSKVLSTGQSMQSYMLNCCLGARLTTAEDHRILLQEAKLLADIDKQLRGIGTNINQLAHHANATGYVHDQNMLNQMASIVVNVRDEVFIRWQSIRQLIAHRSLTQG